ncbi:hypothetical protein [Limnobacter litoralis]|uniref:hypothetical protein n=1 Tax=Limnobacter litoralis TaxID=481366 RepID=UPI0024E0621A|nr:hypothetical protein [Limnobacter litoralis]
MRTLNTLMCALGLTILTACSTESPIQAKAHPDAPSGRITVGPSFWIAHVAHEQQPPPELQRKFSFRVNQLPASQLLELLAGELKTSYDLDECGENPVSLDGNQLSVQGILDSIAQQAEAQVTFKDNTLRLRCETPYLRTYSLDYLAINREMSDTSTLNSDLSSAEAASNPGIRPKNRSELVLNSSQTNDVWHRIGEQLEQLIADKPKSSVVSTRFRSIDESADTKTSRTSPVRRQHSQGLSNSSKAKTDVTVVRKEQHSGNVIVSPESGTVAVVANATGHRRVQQWLDAIQGRLDRQIVIEASIAEITLNRRYERGIDWNVLRQGSLSAGFRVQGLGLTDPGLIVQAARNGTSVSVASMLSLLQEFGQTSVISSPRVATMNQQPAVLKVIDNRVYFTTDVQTSAPTQNSPAFSTFTTHIQTVPVGFLMTVTPQISDDGQIQLRVRPTLSRIVGFVADPNPALKQLDIVSQIPEIQTRELESILRLRNGELAMLGGLKQQDTQTLNRGIPGRPESLASLSDSEKDSTRQIELVILLRAHTANLADSYPHHTGETQPNRLLNEGLADGLRLLQSNQRNAADRLQQALAEQYPNAPEPTFNRAVLSALNGENMQAQAMLQETRARCEKVRCHFSTQLLDALLGPAQP